MALRSASPSASFRTPASSSANGTRRALRRMFAGVASAAVIAFGAASSAQAQQALPYTITTVVGGGAAIAAGANCPANAQYKAADTLGNGCPALNAQLSTDTRGGLTSDGQGNIYIADTNNSTIRKYDPKTGIISRFAGKGTNCTTGNGLLDSSGDGCPSLQTSFTSSPRGIGSDPYGNILVAGYGTQMVSIECVTASPLCPNTSGRKLVGYQYRVAGCVGVIGGGASSATVAASQPFTSNAGTEGDNSYASPFSNLAGDASAGATGTAAGGTCSNAVGILNQPRGAAADKYGNVYIAETGAGTYGTANAAGLRYRLVLGPQTSSFFSGTNPLWAIVNGVTYTSGTSGGGTYTAHEGYIYTILGGFTGTPTARGNACGSYFAEDTIGDGCPFQYSNANGGVQAVTTDSFGNAYFSDNINSVIRVLYVGGTGNPIAAAIVANSGTGTPAVTTPVAGNVYLLAGKGGTTLSTTPLLGSTAGLGSQSFKIQVGPGGNLYVGDTANNAILFYDISTGYIRQLFKTGTACTGHVVGATNGDGCPASQSTFTGGASAGLGVAVDPLGNIYLNDNTLVVTTSTIRKVEALSLVPTIVGSQTAAPATFTQTLLFHGPAGTASMTVTALNAPADISVSTVTCAAAATDTTRDCTVVVTYAPTQPGNRTVQLAVSALDAGSAVLSSKVLPVSSTAIGSALVSDLAVPTTATLGSGITPKGAAIDGGGNVFFVDTTSGNVIKYNVAAASSTIVGTAPANALQVAVDTNGNVYVTSTGSASITKYTLGTDGLYTTGTISNATLTLPQGIAIDPSNNLYVADKTTGTVVLIPVTTAFNTLQPLQTIAQGFSNPVSLTFDGSGNLLLADSTLNAVFRITNVNGIYTNSVYAAAASTNLSATVGATAVSTAPAVTVASLTPAAAAGDAAGNVYIQDATSGKLYNVPVSQTGPTTTTVLTGIGTPSGVTVDGNGVVYSADLAGSLKQVLRNANTYAFGSDTSTVVSAIITNAGNQTATGYQAVGLDSAEFPITSVSPSNCYANASITPGYACSVTTQFTPGSGTGNVSSTLAYTPASSATGFLKFTGVKTGAAVTTTTTISGQTPASPVYSPSATEVTFTVSVAASDSSTATGYVNVTVDALAPVAYTLVSGAVTVPLSGLSAGSHTITAAYPTQSGLTGSTSSTVSFSIAQATTAVTWNPTTTTQQYSAAIGASVLNATATNTLTSATVPGYYLYTATPTAGSPGTIHSASYLVIGTYSLGVTFVPTDTVNFAGSAASVPTYTVTKANTTAGLGVTDRLVASDGTGNYTSVQSAVNTIPATGGGSVYIKPGTYTGDISVFQPNVSLRGLGGNPANVILTHASGAFSTYVGEFTTAYSNGYQLPAGSSLFSGNQGSATLVVDRGVNTAVSPSTLTPLNFYGENFTIANSYNRDTTMTTTYAPSGTCTANAGPAMAYNVLFLAGQQCNSQALAYWNRTDLGVTNNVYFDSGQDTIFSAAQSSTTPSRQYFFRGKVTGVVDFIFGDAASVFDYTTIYTFYRSSTVIAAQNKSVQTGNAGDYLSGYIFNSNVITTYQATGSAPVLARPYGKYSVSLFLNPYIDQLTAAGYTEFTGQTNLPTSTYGEYNPTPYTDPATGNPDLNGVIYLGAAGNTGAGVTGTRETTSQSPGTPMANNSVKTTLTAAEATLYYPNNFLGGTVSSSTVTNWVPTTTLANSANAFATGGTATSTNYSGSVTILMRPQTPGLGAVTNGTYTIPTGTYQLYDGATVLASGSLDASGEAYYTTASLAGGAHSFTWIYSGDSNFNGSTSSAYNFTVNANATTTALTPTTQTITYGQSVSLSANVTATTGQQSAVGGSVSLYVDGSATPAQTVTTGSGVANFTVTGLTAGSHTFTATYLGNANFNASSASSVSATVMKATLTVTALCADRKFDQPDVCGASVSGYQYTDSAATVFGGTPSSTGTATRTSPAGTYTANPSNLSQTTFGAANYTLSTVSSSYNVIGSTPQAVIFSPLPNFPSGGSYQLTARTTSGLPATYTVTTGNATVSGATLTVNGPGTVTVQADSAADAAGDYAAASPVSRSFTAQ